MRSTTGKIDAHLLGDGEGNTVVELTELEDLVVCPRLLRLELACQFAPRVWIVVDKPGCKGNQW